MMTSRLPLLALLTTLLLAPNTQADPSWQEPPANPVILTVTGDLACCPGGKAYFDLARLDALPQTEVKTLTPWTEQSDSFRGVRFHVCWPTYTTARPQPMSTSACRLPLHDLSRWQGAGR